MSAVPKERPVRTSSTAEVVSTDELTTRLGDPTLAVIDARPLHLFNGWRGDASRGGHIPGAVAFPAEWLAILDDEDVAEVLASKGVDRQRAIVLSGQDADDVAPLRDRLDELGYEDVRIHEGWPSWAARDDLPVERLPRYDRLVHVEWLADALGGGQPEAAPGDGFLLFHVNFG